MFDISKISGVPYDECQVINQLQAYNTWRANDEELDLIREIQYSGNYYWQGVVFPGSAYLPVGQLPGGIPANGTINGTVVIPPGTYVTSITHYHSLTQGFKFKLFDKGTKASIFYGDYSLIHPVSGNFAGTGIYLNPPSDTGSNVDTPIGPAYLMNPLIVTGPGVLGWEVVNMAPDTNVVQVLLCCAVPINTKSVCQVVVTKGG